MQNEASRVYETRKDMTRRLAGVHDRREVAESPGHGQVGDIGRPYLACPGDLAAAQEVGVDLVSGGGLGELPLEKERSDAHTAHESRYVVAADEEAPVKEFVLDPAAPVEGKLQMDLVDGRHEGRIPVARAHRIAIETGVGEIEKASLSGEGRGWCLSIISLRSDRACARAKWTKNRSPW